MSSPVDDGSGSVSSIPEADGPVVYVVSGGSKQPLRSLHQDCNTSIKIQSSNCIKRLALRGSTEEDEPD
jgi:hypothetical protein